jgi:nicotinamidase/pyrazinamidase
MERACARKTGFETYVIEDACRGIDTQGSLAKAWADMTRAGVKRIKSDDIAAQRAEAGQSVKPSS